MIFIKKKKKIAFKNIFQTLKKYIKYAIYLMVTAQCIGPIMLFYIFHFN